MRLGKIFPDAKYPTPTAETHVRLCLGDDDRLPDGTCAKYALLNIGEDGAYALARERIAEFLAEFPQCTGGVK